MKWFVSLLLLFGVGLSTKAMKPQVCLSYEPATVTLKGKISRKTFAGPPNYESVKKGDTPEPYWILHLIKPICMDANEKIIGGEKREKKVSSLQLILSGEQYAQYKGLLGKRVEVSGKLMHAHTGHHHTKVLLTVKAIKGVRESVKNKRRVSAQEAFRFTSSEFGDPSSFPHNAAARYACEMGSKAAVKSLHEEENARGKKPSGSVQRWRHSHHHYHYGFRVEGSARG